MHITKADICAFTLTVFSGLVLPFPVAAQSPPKNSCPPSDDCVRVAWDQKDRSCLVQSLPDGKACTAGGRTGTCSSGTCNNCKTLGSAGTLYPKYAVLGLIYSPPGSGAISQAQGTPSKCASASVVDYAAGSSLGTTISAEDSFSQDYSLTVAASLPKPSPTGASISGDYSTTGTTSSSQTISKAQKIEIKGLGNCDGIDHDQDSFILLLNPAVAVYAGEAFERAACVPTAQWSAGVSSSTGTAQWYVVYVQWLKDPTTMPSNVAQQLQNLGFTGDDYKQILSLDPFANGPAIIDSSRFLATTTTFPYENPTQNPVCNNGICTCLAFSGSITNELQTKNTSTSSTKYSVGFKESSGFDIGVVSIKATASQKFTWTASASTTNTTDSTQSALATVECPSVSYEGPTLMSIYEDALFGTFMFQAVTADQGMVKIHAGNITSKSGQPLQHESVALSYGGLTYHTYTDKNGNFSIYGKKEVSVPTNARGALSVRGHKENVAVGESGTSKIAVK